MQIAEDIEAERVLLATVCAPGAENLVPQIIPLLEPKDFMHPTHRAIYEGLAASRIAGETEYGPLVLKRYCDDSRADYGRLIDVLSGEESSNPWRLVEVLVEKRKLRQILKLSSWLQKAAIEDPVEDVLSKANKALQNIGQRGTNVEDILAGDLAMKLHGLEPGHQVFQPSADTGIGWIDEQVLILPGTVTIIGARAKAGKTTGAVQIACRSALRGSHTAFYSLEMPKEMLGAKIVSHVTGVDWKTILHSGIPDAYVPDLARSVSKLNNLSIIEGYANYSWSSIESDIIRRVDKNNLDLVIIDYFEYLRPINPEKGRADVGWAELSKAITSLAKRKNIPIVLLAQLHRIEDGAEPHMGNLAQTDQLQKDASGVIFLYRDKDENHWAKIGGSRYGVGGRASRIDFNGSTNRISEMSLFT